MSERRLKRVLMPKGEVLRLFASAYHPEGYCYANELGEPFPKGATVIAVGYDWQRQAFDAIVEHESFPPVKEGEWLPLANEQPAEFTSVRLWTTEEGEHRRLFNAVRAVKPDEKTVVFVEAPAGNNEAIRQISDVLRFLPEKFNCEIVILPAYNRLLACNVPELVDALPDETRRELYCHLLSKLTARVDELQAKADQWDAVMAGLNRVAESGDPEKFKGWTFREDQP